jgi:predicted O-linked N-acetylglucosamine transferase (SPINDLY family)
MATIEELQELARHHLEAGEYPQAIALCQQILQTRPSDPHTLHVLGATANRLGRPDLATSYLERAISLCPSEALFHCTLATAHNALGNANQAIECLARALELDANCPEAHTGMAAALGARGDLDRAEFHCLEALRLRPNSAEAWNIRGDISRLRGRWEQCLECFRKALQSEPRHAQALNNLAATLQILGRPLEAMEAYKQALAVSPEYAAAHNNLATLYQDAGDLDRAEVHLREAVRLQPHLADAHNNLAGLLQLQARLDEAIASYRAADAAAPGDPGAFSNLLISLNYHPRAEPAALLAEHRRWAERFGSGSIHGPAPDHDRDPHRPLRIGYVSPDLYQHVVANFVAPILTNHDPRQVEMYCYAQVLNPDDMTERIMKSAHGWRSTVGMSDAAVADQIRADRIDILVDLAGHMQGNRLRVFAQKPAPVQATYLGYPNTTGLETIDYRLTDAIADPPGEAPVHTEELFRLPRGFCCYLPKASDPPVGPLPAERAGFVTFGSLHTLQRLNRGVLDTWCALLRAVPTSRLLIFRHTLRGKVRDALFQYLTSQGIAAHRFDLENTVKDAGGYAGVYHRVDIALDTFPWSGHSTGCQSLWMGVPVVTLRGPRFASRMMASVMHHIGLPNWIADTREQYVEVAAKLAGDMAGLARLRATLRGRLASSLCDGAAFTRCLEAGYRKMWQSGLPGLHK